MGNKISSYCCTLEVLKLGRKVSGLSTCRCDNEERDGGWKTWQKKSIVSILLIIAILTVGCIGENNSEKVPEYSNVARVLVDIALAEDPVQAARETGLLAETPGEFSVEKPIFFWEGRINVEAYLKDANTPLPEGYDVIESGRIDNIAGIWIKPEEILAFSKEPNVTIISLPSIGSSEEVISEGVGVSKADLLHQLGITGIKGDGTTTVKVAVIDGGFDNTNTEISGNIAGSWAPQPWSPWTGSSHGTSVAEIIVDINLMTSGNVPVKAVLVKEYIPDELVANTNDGIFTGFGLMWQMGTIERKETASCTLTLPEVTEPTPFTLKTVVEFQTFDDLETIEKTTILTVNPKGPAKLNESGQSKKVKAKGKGYDKVHYATPNFKAEEDESNGKKKGHDKYKDKPVKPPKDKDPGSGKDKDKGKGKEK